MIEELMRQLEQARGDNASSSSGYDDSGSDDPVAFRTASRFNVALRPLLGADFVQEPSEPSQFRSSSDPEIHVLLRAILASGNPSLLLKELRDSDCQHVVDFLQKVLVHQHRLREYFISTISTIRCLIHRHMRIFPWIYQKIIQTARSIAYVGSFSSCLYNPIHSLRNCSWLTSNAMPEKVLRWAGLLTYSVVNTRAAG